MIERKLLCARRPNFRDRLPLGKKISNVMLVAQSEISENFDKALTFHFNQFLLVEG